MTAAHPAVVPEAPSAASAALDLHLWRRLDWRLLLPGLRTTRIAVAGAVDDELLAALRLLADDVQLPRTPAEWHALSGTCDAVVLVCPAPTDVGMASGAVRPGGWLYAEVRGRAGRTAPWTVAGWRTVFGDAGLQDVTGYWHVPGPGGPSTIVALDAVPAVRHVLGRERSGRLGTARARLAGGPLAARLLPRLVREGSVVGRRPLPLS